ncbi:hypothetical protein TNCV_506351 [Trichonephila clavipes]|nr:hypothetical protein TNCV_506351 [Trichonephila clavipes]
MSSSLLDRASKLRGANPKVLTLPYGCVSLVVKVTGSRHACHEFEPNTTVDLSFPYTTYNGNITTPIGDGTHNSVPHSSDVEDI